MGIQWQLIIVGKIVFHAPQFEEGLYPIEAFRNNKKIEYTSDTPPLKKLSMVASVYQVLVLGTRDYVNKNSFTGTVIGLSGDKGIAYDKFSALASAMVTTSQSPAELGKNISRQLI